MRFRVIVNGKDLGESNNWETAADFVQRCLEENKITHDDLNGPQNISVVETDATPPKIIMPRPADPDNILP